MWVPWGSGRRGERVSLYFFCYVVTVLQKAGNLYRERLSAVTESVTQPFGFVTNTTGHDNLLRDLRSLRRKKPQQANSSRPAVTRSVTNSVTNDLLRQTDSGWVYPPTNKVHRPFLGRRSGSSNSVPFIPQPCPPTKPFLRPGWPGWRRCLGDVSPMGLSSHNTV